VPLGKPDPVELHPDIQADHRHQTFHNYLDEFLLAVRVFGFLEKPVSVIDQYCCIEMSIQLDAGVPRVG
jgi:hypothetical protein